MMRVYSNKTNVQKKPYYSDRFWVAPQVPRFSVESDAIFAADVAHLKEKFDIKETYIEKDQLVVYINPSDNVEVLKTLRDELSYNFLSEHSAIDWLAKRGEFEIFYQMLSTCKKKRMRVKCFIKEKKFSKV